MNRVTIDAEPMTIMELYNKVAIAAGVNPDDVKSFDCTKILVARNLQDAVIEKYRQCCNDYRLAFGMAWCCYGPKTEDTLEEGTVEYEDDFLKLEA